MGKRKDRYHKRKHAPPGTRRAITKLLKRKKLESEQQTPVFEEQSTQEGDKETLSATEEIAEPRVSGGNQEQARLLKRKKLESEQQTPVFEEQSTQEGDKETLRATEEIAEPRVSGGNQEQASTANSETHNKSSSAPMQPSTLRMTMAELAQRFPFLAQAVNNAMQTKGSPVEQPTTIRKPAISKPKGQPTRSVATKPAMKEKPQSRAECAESPEAAELSKLKARQKEAEQHQLAVETFHKAGDDPGVKSLTGRRIVDIQHFTTEVRKLEGHECRINPQRAYFSYSHEIHHGLRSILVYKCTECGQRRNISTTSEHPNELNSAAVQAMMSMGKGHEPFTRFLKTLGIPVPAYTTFKKFKDKLKQVRGEPG